MLAGYAARMVPASHRGRATAIVLAGITAALSLGLPAGTALADMAGWRAGFASLAVMALLLVAWVRRTVPPFPGQARPRRTPPRQVASQPGIRTILAVTLILLTGHQAMYTYIAPFAARAGFGHTSLILLVFGTATAGGLAVTGILADRHLRPVLLTAPGLAAVMAVHGRGGRDHDLGALGRLDRRARVRLTLDELLQPLPARLGRRMALRFLLGIDQEPGTAGFGQLLIRPHPGGSLSWASGSYRSVRGPVSAGWQRSGGRFAFRVELPPNVTASIRIPSGQADEVRDAAGNPPVSLASFPGARGAQEAVFRVGSGVHEFSGPLG